MQPDGSLECKPMAFRQVRGVPLATVHAGPDEAQLREAHDAGLREGEAAGRRRAAAEYQAAIERTAQSIKELAGLRARLRHEAEGDLVQLALAIARRILRRELAVDPDALRGLAVAALAKLRSQEIVRVKVHASQVNLLTACLRDSGDRIQVSGDPSCEPGTLVFETQSGGLDASVETQLEEIGRGLADRLRTNG
jgi:flagellar assembly protein FliH